MFGKVLGVNLNSGKVVLNITAPQQGIYFQLAFDQNRKALFGVSYYDAGSRSIASTHRIDPTTGKQTQIGVFPGDNLPGEGGAVYDSANGIFYWTGVDKKTNKIVTIMGMDVDTGKVVSSTTQSTTDGIIYWRVDFDTKLKRLVSITSNNSELDANLFLTNYNMGTGIGVPIGKKQFGSYPDYVPTSSALSIKTRKLYYNSENLNNVGQQKLYAVDADTGAQLAVVDLKIGYWYCDLSGMAIS